MYELFRRPAARFTGKMTYPQLDYLRRSYLGQVESVKEYYYRYPKRVDADNPLGNILLHIPKRDDMDDQRYMRYVEDAYPAVARAFGFTSPIFRGKVHEAGVTLGPKSDEILLVVESPQLPTNLDKSWYRLSALNYLYHTRTDLGLPVLNNSTPGKGFGVSTLDIPIMALQYRYWLKYQTERYDQKESVYRFIGGFVLPNAIGSYHDIAMFNRLSRYSNGVGVPKHPAPHPFYLTDHSRRVEQYCKWILEHQERRSEDIEQVVSTTPVILKNSLWEVMQLPKEPVTRANEWALQLARLPYIRYIVETAVKAERGDRTYLNSIYISLIDANRDSIFSGVGSPRVVSQYRAQIREMITLLESKKQGWA